MQLRKLMHMFTPIICISSNISCNMRISLRTFFTCDWSSTWDNATFNSIIFAFDISSLDCKLLRADCRSLTSDSNFLFVKTKTSIAFAAEAASARMMSKTNDVKKLEYWSVLKIRFKIHYTINGKYLYHLWK